MRRACAMLVALLFWSGCATAQRYEQQAQRRSSGGATTPQRNGPPPLLWEVTKPEHGTLFLFGTMHFGVASDELPDTVIETLASCDTYVLESDPTAADQTRLADLMMLPKGAPGLDEQMGEERFDKLISMVDGMFDRRTATRVQPWVLEAAVIGGLLPTEEAMEVGLTREAEARAMRVEYLEDWETQITTLNRVSSADALAEIVDDPDAFRERTRQMSADYLRGDIDALEQHIFGSDYEAQDELFETRNRSWLQRLDELAADRRVFVAVGAGHLIGPDSVLQMLAERGYEVQRVR